MYDIFLLKKIADYFLQKNKFQLHELILKELQNESDLNEEIEEPEYLGEDLETIFTKHVRVKKRQSEAKKKESTRSTRMSINDFRINRHNISDVLNVTVGSNNWKEIDEKSCDESVLVDDKDSNNENDNLICSTPKSGVHRTDFNNRPSIIPRCDDRNQYSSDEQIATPEENVIQHEDVIEDNTGEDSEHFNSVMNDYYEFVCGNSYQIDDITELYEENNVAGDLSKTNIKQEANNASPEIMTPSQPIMIIPKKDVEIVESECFEDVFSQYNSQVKLPSQVLGLSLNEEEDELYENDQEKEREEEDKEIRFDFMEVDNEVDGTDIIALEKFPMATEASVDNEELVEETPTNDFDLFDEEVRVDDDIMVNKDGDVTTRVDLSETLVSEEFSKTKKLSGDEDTLMDLSEVEVNSNKEQNKESQLNNLSDRKSYSIKDNLSAPKIQINENKGYDSLSDLSDLDDAEQTQITHKGSEAESLIDKDCSEIDLDAAPSIKLNTKVAKIPHRKYSLPKYIPNIYYPIIIPTESNDKILNRYREFTKKCRSMENPILPRLSYDVDNPLIPREQRIKLYRGDIKLDLERRVLMCPSWLIWTRALVENYIDIYWVDDLLDAVRTTGYPGDLDVISRGQKDLVLRCILMDLFLLNMEKHGLIVGKYDDILKKTIYMKKAALTPQETCRYDISRHIYGEVLFLDPDNNLTPLSSRKICAYVAPENTKLILQKELSMVEMLAAINLTCSNRNKQRKRYRISRFDLNNDRKPQGRKRARVDSNYREIVSSSDSSSNTEEIITTLRAPRRKGPQINHNYKESSTSSDSF